MKTVFHVSASSLRSSSMRCKNSPISAWKLHRSTVFTMKWWFAMQGWMNLRNGRRKERRVIVIVGWKILEILAIWMLFYRHSIWQRSWELLCILWPKTGNCRPLRRKYMLCSFYSKNSRGSSVNRWSHYDLITLEVSWQSLTDLLPSNKMLQNSVVSF
jgi:hypothetical protein